MCMKTVYPASSPRVSSPRSRPLIVAYPGRSLFASLAFNKHPPRRFTPAGCSSRELATCRRGPQAVPLGSRIEHGEQMASRSQQHPAAALQCAEHAIHLRLCVAACTPRKQVLARSEYGVEPPQVPSSQPGQAGCMQCASAHQFRV